MIGLLHDALQADPDDLTTLTPLTDTVAESGTSDGLGGARRETHTLYVDGTRGTIRLLAGMVMANRPLSMPRNMTVSIATACAAGAYGIFYGSIWTLSSMMSPWRLTLVMLVAIGLLAGWLIVTNGLWTRGVLQRRSSRLDNLATVLTVVTACLTVYLLLLLLLGVAAAVIIPPRHLSEELEARAGLDDYLRLVWLATSMGTMAGAVGSSFDDSDRIRDATYALREKHRVAVDDAPAPGGRPRE